MATCLQRQLSPGRLFQVYQRAPVVCQCTTTTPSVLESVCTTTDWRSLRLVCACGCCAQLREEDARVKAFE